MSSLILPVPSHHRHFKTANPFCFPDPKQLLHLLLSIPLQDLHNSYPLPLQSLQKLFKNLYILHINYIHYYICYVLYHYTLDKYYPFIIHLVI